MSKKIWLILIFITLFSGCGFKPILSTSDYNFSLKLDDVKGDNDLTKFIKFNLNRYQNINSEIFYISIQSSYEKNALSKNKSGKIIEFSIISITEVKIRNNNKEKNISLINEANMTNISDNYDEKIYERNIKQSFANKITKDLIIEILNFDDN